MKGPLLKLWTKVLHVGYDPSMDYLQQMRLFTLNGFLCIGAILTLVFCITFLALGSYNAIQGFSVLPVVGLSFYFNFKGRLTAARFVFTYALMALILFLALADRRTGTEYVLIALGCCGVLLFEKVSSIILCFISAFACYLTYTIVDSVLPFEPQPNTPYLAIQNALMFLSGFAVVSISLVFRSTVTKYALDLKSANHEIAAMNEELATSNEELYALTENLEMMVNQRSADLQAYRDAIDVSLMATTFDFSGKILTVNEQVVKNLGYTAEELVGQSISKLGNSTDSSGLEKLLQQARSGKSWHAESMTRTKNGTVVWTDAAIIPVTGPYVKVPYILTLGFLISEKKELELAQLKAVEALESLAYHTSHEIKGPLSRIIGLTHLLERDYVEKKELTYVAKQLVVCSSELNRATTDLTNFINSHEEDFSKKM